MKRSMIFFDSASRWRFDQVVSFPAINKYTSALAFSFGMLSGTRRHRSPYDAISCCFAHSKQMCKRNP